MAARRGRGFNQILLMNFKIQLFIVTLSVGDREMRSLGKIPKKVSDRRLLGSIYE